MTTHEASNTDSPPDVPIPAGLQRHEPPTQEPLLQFARSLALGGAALIGSLLGEAELRVHTKSTSTDLVTHVDSAVESWLVAQIRRARPDDVIVGEEGGTHGTPVTEPTDAVRWVLDPVDGTVNFVHGIPRYAVSIGVEVGGEREVGCVLNPATGELFWARRGGGSWREFVGAGAGSRAGEATRLTGPPTGSLQLAVIATGFGYDAARRGAQAGRLAELISDLADVRRFGAASLDLCSVALGEIDGYYESGLNEWDYCAGVLIAQEAGCVVTGPRGGAPTSELVAVAGGSIAPGFFELLERVGVYRL